MVHEFVKTITEFFNDELSSSTSVFANKEKLDEVAKFLNSATHVTEFLEHFTD
jgi:hypothetical protein